MSNNNSPATTKQKSVANFLNMPSTAKFLESTLQEKKAEFISNLIAMADSDANLAMCEPSALMKCAMNATSLNLPLNKNLGYAYIIPYKNGRSGKYEPNFQIGYKGVLQLAIRTGAYRYINATEVREGEIERNKITGELTFLKENPTGRIVGYVAFLELMSGFTASLYMSEEEIEQHALKFSKMYQSDKRYNTSKSKWSDPDARPKMALKTVLKGLLGTYGLMTTEFEKAFAVDNDKVETSPSGNRVEDIDSEEVKPQPEPEAEQSAEPETIQI